MTRSITFTLDLEDHRPDTSLPERYGTITDQILQFLDAHAIKATVFTVGSLAEENPALIKRIHDAGHEIAHHSHDHVTIEKQSPETFRDDTKRAKEILEGIIGAPIKGYRAPVFSLTRQSLWALDILKELGFSYSSSVLPAANPLHGLTGVPLTPFRWSNGLVEIPAPVGSICGARLPYLGGFYFRYLPYGLIKAHIEKAANDETLWTYVHPYDFDPIEKNWRIKGASMPVSLLLWFNRKNTFKKMERLAGDFEFDAPFAAQSFSGDLKTIDPSELML